MTTGGFRPADVGTRFNRFNNEMDVWISEERLARKEEARFFLVRAGSSLCDVRRQADLAKVKWHTEEEINGLPQACRPLPPLPVSPASPRPPERVSSKAGHLVRCCACTCARG